MAYNTGGYNSGGYSSGGYNTGGYNTGGYNADTLTTSIAPSKSSVPVLSGLGDILGKVGGFVASEAPAVGVNLEQSVRDLISGKNAAMISGGRQGNPLGIGNVWYDLVGKQALAQSNDNSIQSWIGHHIPGTQNLFYTPEEIATNEVQLKNPSFWDKAGSALNVASFVPVGKVAKIGGDVLSKAIEKGIAPDYLKPIANVMGDLPNSIRNASKDIQDSYVLNVNKMMQRNPLLHSTMARDIWKSTPVSDIEKYLESNPGKRILAWVHDRANQLGGQNFNGDVLRKAWNDVGNYFSGLTPDETTKAMDRYMILKNQAKSYGNEYNSLVDSLKRFQINLPKMTDTTLYKPSTGDTLGYYNDASKFLTSSIQKLRDSAFAKLPTEEQSQIQNLLDKVSQFEQDNFYRVGRGAQDFIDPRPVSEFANIPAPTKTDLSKIPGGFLKTMNDTYNVLTHTFLNPERYSNDTLSAITQNNVLRNAVELGISPQGMDRLIGHLYDSFIPGTPSFMDKIGKGGMFNLPQQELQNYFSNILKGQDSSKYLINPIGTFTEQTAKRLALAFNEAMKNGSRLDSSLAGIRNAGINPLHQIATKVKNKAQDTPWENFIKYQGTSSSPIAKAATFLRFGINPLFQLYKLPTKLGEIQYFGRGINPFGKGLDPEVENYIKNLGRSEITQALNPQEYALQGMQLPGQKLYQDIFGKVPGVGKLVQIEPTAYGNTAKSILKSFGYDVEKAVNAIKSDPEIKGTAQSKAILDYMRSIPEDVLKKADFAGRQVHGYANGVSAMARTINSIYWPFLFHSKVARELGAGFIENPYRFLPFSQSVATLSNQAVSPQGQQWYSRGGVLQDILKGFGQAEPINLPALTGNPQNEYASPFGNPLTTPYNMYLSPLIQMYTDITNKPLSIGPETITQSPRSTAEIQNPIVYNALTIPGLEGLFSRLKSGTQNVNTPGYFSPEGIKKYDTSQAKAAKRQGISIASKASLTQSASNFLTTLPNASEQQLEEYATTKAFYDNPSSPTLQQQEYTEMLDILKREQQKKLTKLSSSP